MNDFPGKRIILEVESLISTCLSLLNPKGIDPVENLKSWVEVNKNLYETDIFSDSDAFYLIYKHPVHAYLDKLYWAEKHALINFMKKRIDLERGEGLDIIIVPPSSYMMLVCNHDGEVYQVKTDKMTIPSPDKD